MMVAMISVPGLGMVVLGMAKFPRTSPGKLVGVRESPGINLTVR